MSVSHSYQTVPLARGKHASPRNGACVMELASMLAGEEFTDRPAAVDPVIAAFLRAYNDAVDDRRRQDLFRYAADTVGTRAPADVVRARAERCLAELRRVRRWPRRALATPRTPPESVPGMERLAGRLARELHRSGAGSHARALRFVDELVALGAPGRDDRAAPTAAVSRSARSRGVAAAR
jgi:hypothetical protein